MNQRSDLIAARNRVWGQDETFLCATNDCPNDAVEFSCYCSKCEDEFEEEGD